MHIIIKDKENRHHKFGKTRSEHEENMQKEWGGTMSDEQLSKLKYLEKKRKERFGFDKQFARLIEVDKVK